MGTNLKHRDITRPEKHTEPKRSRIVGEVLTSISGLLFLIALILMYTHSSDFRILMLPAALLFLLGIKLSSIPASEIMAIQTESPVLFLRPFSHDRHLLYELFPTLLGAYEQSTEESFTQVFSKVGPMVAIGRPGEKLSTQGAARLYVPEQQWRKRICELMKQAQIVIISVAESDGIKWEIEKAIKTLKPKQLLFYFAPKIRVSTIDNSYKRFRDNVQPYLTKTLPDNINRANFLYFDEHWNPILLGPIEQPIRWLSSIYNIPARRLRSTLQPFLDRLTLDKMSLGNSQLHSRKKLKFRNILTKDRCIDIFIYIVILIPYFAAVMFLTVIATFLLVELGILSENQTGLAGFLLTLLFFLIGAWYTRPWKSW